jgi:hypothetical protein
MNDPVTIEVTVELTRRQKYAAGLAVLIQACDPRRDVDLQRIIRQIRALAPKLTDDRVRARIYQDAWEAIRGWWQDDATAERLRMSAWHRRLAVTCGELIEKEGGAL